MSTCLLGALAGDVIGSVYQFIGQKSADFPLFSEDSQLTDDSVLTLAVADAILNGRGYLECIREYALKYPFAPPPHPPVCRIAVLYRRTVVLRGTDGATLTHRVATLMRHLSRTAGEGTAKPTSK